MLEGNYVKLEPLALKHAPDLWEAQSKPGEKDRFKFLLDAPPATQEELRAWIEKRNSSQESRFYAVIDKSTHKVGGRQALMREVPEHGVVEIGSIYWGPAIARTRIATEALFVIARHVFETLKYRRLEWKCNARNEASRKAAIRFGFTFEGVFRQHMFVRGENRDTVWYSMLDKEWPTRKECFEAWLDPLNFTSDGSQKSKLTMPPQNAIDFLCPS